jgi:hypothetical protein
VDLLKGLGSYLLDRILMKQLSDMGRAVKDLADPAQLGVMLAADTPTDTPADTPAVSNK